MWVVHSIVYGGLCGSWMMWGLCIMWVEDYVGHTFFFVCGELCGSWISEVDASYGEFWGL